jgi:hypothetical protein
VRCERFISFCLGRRDTSRPRELGSDEPRDLYQHFSAPDADGQFKLLELPALIPILILKLY